MSTMFDTHCHLTNEKSNHSEVRAAARAAGVTGMIAVATDAADAREAMQLAQQHQDIWFTAGVHPSEAGRTHDLDEFDALIDHPKCVAWGEMGLDGHWPDPPMDRQRPLLEAQLQRVMDAQALARGPRAIVLHSRKAVDEVLAVIGQTTLAGDRFVFHCFTEGPEAVERILTSGASVSFTGVVTYRNAAEVAAASDLVPLDRLMVETDSPYLTPEPHRGTRPNTPEMVVHVAAFLAKRRGLSLADFAKATDATAIRVYGLSIGEASASQS